MARRVVGGFQPLGTNRSEPGGAGGMRADGGEAVEVRKREGLAEGTNEEDGRHGLRGRSEVGELVRMRSRLHASAADQAEPEACGPMAVKPLRCASARGRLIAAGRAEPEACGPMAVKPLRCASERGWPRAQTKRTAAMVSEAVRRSASWSGCGAGCMPARQTRRSRRHAGRWR